LKAIHVPPGEKKLKNVNILKKQAFITTGEKAGQGFAAGEMSFWQKMLIK